MLHFFLMCANLAHKSLAVFKTYTFTLTQPVTHERVQYLHQRSLHI